MIYLELFWSFFQIGLFSIGGGYAAMPLIQNQVVDIHPLADDDGLRGHYGHCRNDPRPHRRKRCYVCWYSGGGSAGGTDCHDRLYFSVLRHRHDAGLRITVSAV